MNWFSKRAATRTSDKTTSSVALLRDDQPSSISNPPFDNLLMSAVSPHTQDVDTLIAREINQLSFQERSRIQEEIHGVHSLAPKETPEFVQEAVFQLEQQLHAILHKKLQRAILHQGNIDHQRKEQAFYEALSLAVGNPYLQSTSFRLTFLRANLMDAKKAAARLLGHLRLLHKYFGEVVLHRPLRFKDLGELEQAVLRQGMNQILPSRDRANRLILFFHGSFEGENVTNLERMRVHLYIATVLSEDPETQRNGVVLLFSTDNRILADICQPDSQEDFAATVATYPVRWSAIHICIPAGPTYQLLKAVITMTMSGKDERLRVKFYPELLKLETQYQLMSYGIPIQDIPVSFTGTMKLKNLNHWIQTRVAIDEARDRGLCTKAMIVHPRTHDVLFCKGGSARHHGNLEFHQIMEHRIHQYNSTNSRMEKREIRDEIITTVRFRNGRFLVMTSNGCWWVEILDEDTVHKKVTSALNDHMRTMRARQNRQKIESDFSKFLNGRRQRSADSNCCS